MEEQNQGWSTGAKVTAATVAAIAAAAGVDQVFNDGALTDSLFGSATDLKDATIKATQEAAQAIKTNTDKLLEWGASASQDAITATGQEIADIATSNNIALPENYDANSISDVKELTQSLLRSSSDSVKAAVEESLGKVVDLAKDSKVTAGNIITNNPIPTALAATAIAGGTGYIAGRSAGARSASQGQAYA